MLVAAQTLMLWIMVCIAVGSFVFLIFKRREAHTSKLVKVLTVLGAVEAIALLLTRMIATKTLLFSNGLEFGFWLNALLMLILCFFTIRLRLPLAGTIIYPVVAALSVWMTSFNLTHQPPSPALRSYWLYCHVSAAVVAYSAFVASFALSVLLIVVLRRGQIIKALPDAETLNEWAYRAVVIGMPFQTIMLITGAVWAEYAWGTFWSWDPKETWALITWFIYAIYLHLRIQGWSERNLLLVNALGFAAILFTFLGVSYLLPGLHSYL